MKSKGDYKKEVAYKDNTTSIENLPYPYVFYPGFYGAFVGFQSRTDLSIYLCSCSQKAIKNYIILKSLEKPIGRNVDHRRDYILSSHDFPIVLTEELMKKKSLKLEEVFAELNFKDNLCHECNQIAPNYRYCHEMYGGSFRQTYGWYIEKQRYEFGIVFRGPTSRNEQGYINLNGPYTLRVILHECPDTVLSLLSKNEFNYFDKNENIVDYVIDKSQNNEIHNCVENQVRKKFGFKKVGEAWVNETILYNTLKSMFPDYRVIHHYRPNFLKGLEIDVFIEELKMGFEYQGVQHFEPLKHFGGEKSHNDLKLRDKLKRKICEEMGIKLIYITYKEDVSEPLIRFKMSDDRFNI